MLTNVAFDESAMYDKKVADILNSVRDNRKWGQDRALQILQLQQMSNIYDYALQVRIFTAYVIYCSFKNKRLIQFPEQYHCAGK